MDLRDSYNAKARRPIVVFEVARRSPITLLAILPTPFLVLLLVPFFGRSA